MIHYLLLWHAQAVPPTALVHQWKKAFNDAKFLKQLDTQEYRTPLQLAVYLQKYNRDKQETWDRVTLDVRLQYRIVYVKLGYIDTILGALVVSMREVYYIADAERSLLWRLRVGYKTTIR